MNTKKNEDSKLPEGWIICASKSSPGRKYYFNRKTGSSSWTKPQPQDPIFESKNQRKKKNAKEKAKAQAQAQKNKKTESPKKNLKRKSDGDSINLTTIPINAQIEEATPPKKIKKPGLSPIKKINKSLVPISPLKPTEANTSIVTSSPLIKAGTSKSPNNKQVATISPLKRRNISTSSNQSLNSEAGTSTSESSFCSITKPNKKRKKNLANERLALLRAELSAEVNESQKESANTQEKGNVDQLAELHSVPHPSQFIAANKIICSMKAQLPEKYDQKVKQKDMFADIEQGICSQNTEYPYMKHPATPPQFSQASKLLSALKSKLLDKCVSHKPEVESPVVLKSANERLKELRMSMSNKMDEGSGDNSSHCNEPMDVDVKEVQSKQNVPAPSIVKDNNSKNNVVLVVDTNIFIHELDLIKNVMNSHIEGYSQPPTLLVPWRVVNELDNLKDNNNGKGAVCKRARPAMDYLYKKLPESDRIKVQPIRDANSHIYPCESPDDEILNCCLQQAEKGNSVILLSNDKNLCIKAVANGVPRRSLSQFTLTSPPEQSQVKPELTRRTQKCIYTLLSNILENEMRAKYNELWLHVVAAVPPWSLADVLRCLLKHWIAVFKDVFPRIEHLLTDLNHSLSAIEKNAPNITQSQLQNFKELCLEVAKRCQIIPEYMELAKTTVAKLQKDEDDDDDEENCVKNDKGDEKCVKNDDDNVVIEAFESVWTVYSSYCAKLASSLGISHSIEDKMPGNNTVEELTSKLDEFGNQIAAITLAIQGVLSEEETQHDDVLELERSLKESLSVVGLNDAPINTDNLNLFSTNCRMMLQEAHSKFSQTWRIYKRSTIKNMKKCPMERINNGGATVQEVNFKGSGYGVGLK